MARHYVYLIYAMRTDVVKVGCTNAPKTRLATLQTGCPLELVMGYAYMFGTADEAKRAERLVHDECHFARVRGEWFREGPVEEFIWNRPMAFIEDVELSEYWHPCIGGDACLISDRPELR